MSVPFTTRDEALSSGPRYNGYAHSFAGMGVQFILFMGIDMGISILLARRWASGTACWRRVSLTTVLLGAPVRRADRAGADVRDVRCAPC
jgi:ABC-2 type transport system permease protein